jgi:hypothetical protein
MDEALAAWREWREAQATKQRATSAYGVRADDALWSAVAAAGEAEIVARLRAHRLLDAAVASCVPVDAA